VGILTFVQIDEERNSALITLCVSVRKGVDHGREIAASSAR
jgi:hypothetical protein